MAQLSAEQLAQVEQWAADGANLNQVQDRLKADFGITLTYLDARLLMLDVGVRIKDRPRDPVPVVAAPLQDGAVDENLDNASAEPAAEGALQLTADQVATPGTLISGKVVFTDGQAAAWHLDERGSLGLSGAPKGYQPPPADIPIFQQELDLLMQRAGF